jgi:hypothetical protein
MAEHQHKCHKTCADQISGLLFAKNANFSIAGFALKSLDQRVGQQGHLRGLGQDGGDVPLWHLTNRDARHFFSRRDINDGHRVRAGIGDVD